MRGEIAKWMNGRRDYGEGCMLFNDYGHRVHAQNYYVAVKKSLAADRQPEKLARLLREIYDKLPKKAEQVIHQGNAVVGTVVHSEKPSGNLGKKEKLLAELNARVLEYYQNIGSRWKPKLHEAQTDIERFEICKVIDRLEKELRQVLSNRDYVEEHGELPKAKRVKKEKSMEANTAKAALEYVNVQKYVSLYNRKIDEAKKELLNQDDKANRAKLDKNICKWELKLSNYKKELAELEKLVKQ